MSTEEILQWQRIQRMKETIQQMEQVIKEKEETIQQVEQMAEGTFYTPIEETWEEYIVKVTTIKGVLDKIGRKEGYYRDVEIYHDIVRSVSSPMGTAVTQAIQDVRHRKVEANDFNPKKRKRNKSRSESSGVLSQDTSEGRSSQKSSGKNPDYMGVNPSSKAPLVPASSCCMSFGVILQRVCGVNLETPVELIRLAESIKNCRTNFFRCKTMHSCLMTTRVGCLFQFAHVTSSKTGKKAKVM